MKIVLFAKVFFILLLFSLVFFIFTQTDLLGLAKMLAASALLAVLFAFVYPELRGIKHGDTVMVISSDSPYSILGRFGTALNNAKKNSEIKIRLADGSEISGIVESYEGVLTPPRVRAIYEERLVEKQI